MLQENFNEMRAVLVDIRTTQGTTNERFDHIETRLEATATKDDINELKTAIATKDDINELKTVMATKDDITDVKATQAQILKLLQQKPDE